MNNRICFLDFDGVFTATHRAFISGQDFDITSARVLDKVLKETNCQIVVSSTWRLGTDMLTLSTYLRLCGIKAPLHKDYKTTEVHDKFRGNQIKLWLDKHPEVTEYVIVDDDNDMLEEQIDRFIHTDGSEGFGAKDYTKFKKLFSDNSIKETT